MGYASSAGFEPVFTEGKPCKTEKKFNPGSDLRSVTRKLIRSIMVVTPARRDVDITLGRKGKPVATSEVFVDRALPDGRFVVTNNSPMPIPAGTVFVKLQSKPVPLNDLAAHERPIAEEQAVSLELCEVEVLRNSMREIPKGYSAAVRFGGNGLKPLCEHLAKKGTAIYVFLSTSQNAA